MLNVDIAATAFLQARPCLDHLLESASMQSMKSALPSEARERASRAFQGIKVGKVGGLELIHKKLKDLALCWFQ